MARLLARLVALNDGWARPLGEFNRRWISAIFRPIRPIKDLLHGRWLGHPLHAASTDLPIGLLLGAVILDLLGQTAAADIVLLATIVTMLLSALSGMADYADTSGTALTRATLHSTLMVVALVLLVVSAVMRAGAPADRTVPVALSIIGFLLVTAGAFVGGDVVYVLGNMVSRHAFRGAGTKWIRLDTGDISDLAATPRGDADEDACRDQRPRGRPARGHGPGAACRLCPCGRPARPGDDRRRMRRMPMARLPVPAERRAGPPGPVGLRPAELRDPLGRGWRLRGAPASRRVGPSSPCPPSSSRTRASSS